jgi:radical SAM protein with 4Fe4S-binding SPASM domain
MNRVLLPPRIRVWNQGDWHLYFDPHNFCWARVNESGRFILEQLRRFRRLDQIADEVASSFGMQFHDALAAIQSFVDNLVEEGFLHRDEYHEREELAFEPRQFAYAVYLHLTNDCNLECPYCYNKSDREFKLALQKKGRFAPILNTQEYKDLISRLIELGTRRILFTGGEPLMRRDLLELMEFTRSRNEDIEIEILTNGILIREDVAEKLCDLADAVTISLDGHERHLHEHCRGKNTFAPTIRGIKKLVEVRRKRGLSRPSIAVVPALTDTNIGFMKEIFEFSLDELGVDGLAPILFQAGDHQELSLQQIPKFGDFIAADLRTKKYLAERALLAGHEQRPAKPLSPRNHCGVGNGEFSVDASGFVYPCQSLHFDEFLCGNIRETDIKEIFEHSEVMVRTRGTVVDRLKVCRHCDLKYLCNGGCRATAYNVYRTFDSHNEVYCRYLERISVDRLWATTSAGTSDMPLNGGEAACP